MPISGGSSGGSGTPSDNSISTPKIQDDAVTLSKIEEIATARILGRVTSGSGNPEALTAANALSVLGVEAITDGDQVALSIFDTAPADGTITLLGYAPYAFTINSLKQRKTVSGTVTVAVKINGVNVTGLSAVAVSSSAGNTNATAANTVAKGDAISLTYSSSSAPVNFSATLIGTRT